jgi:hypothetical protein
MSFVLPTPKIILADGRVLPQQIVVEPKRS